MKRMTPILSVLYLIAFLASCGEDPVRYVDPFIGASTNTDVAGVYHGLGKTFPGATTPFGMVQVSPNTVTGGDNGPGYSYEMRNFLVMPTTGPLKTVAGTE